MNKKKGGASDFYCIFQGPAKSIDENEILITLSLICETLDKSPVRLPPSLNVNNTHPDGRSFTEIGNHNLIENVPFPLLK